MQPTIDFLEPRPDAPDHVAVKVCGVTTGRQATDITALGVDAIGVNYWPESKRYVSSSKAASWVPDACQETSVVAVFVNAFLDDIEEMFRNEMFGIAQLHGDEDAGFCSRLADMEIPFIKAIGVGSDADIGDLDSFGTRYFLLDAKQDGYGGGGISFDWDLAGKIIADHPDKRFLLAGGIKPTSVRKAILQAKPAAVDVASGVESGPGLKDLQMVEDLVTLARK